MANLKRVVLGLCLFFVFGTGSAQADDTEKQNAVIELFKITNTAEFLEKSVVSNLQLTLGNVYKNKPEIPEELKQRTFDILVETFKENIDDMLISMAQIVEESFTLDEIQEMTEFYKSELGQKILHKLPAVMQSATILGMQWGQKIAVIAMERVRKELASKGYDI
jgi:hypothetical protein